MVNSMSANEIIEEIKKLSGDEQKKVVAYISEIQQASPSDSDEDVSPEFKRIVDEMFTTNRKLFQKLAQ